MIGTRPIVADDVILQHRAALLQRARTAVTPTEVARTRQALRAWLEQHPADTELLLADDLMQRPPRWSGWAT